MKNFNISENIRPRVAMLSTHGYVSANPALGLADTGGQVVYVLEVSKKLAHLGFAVDIWTRQFDEQTEIEAVIENVQIVRMPCGGTNFIPKEILIDSIPEWVDNFMKFVEKKGWTYSFISSHYWDAGYAGTCVAKLLKVPHLFTPHSLGYWKKIQMEKDYPENQHKFEAQYNFSKRILIEQEILTRADKIVATSPQQWEILAQSYSVQVDKMHMIPPGYDDNRFYPVSEASRQSVRKKFGFKGHVVLALGRLARNKGYDLLISGFSVLAERIPDACLVLAIGGDRLTEQELLIQSQLEDLTKRLGLMNRVYFISYIPDEELADYYRSADLFVLSSRYEPFGMTAVEAMACGTPTVITVHGGLHRAMAFGRHALFADPLDKEDLGIMMAKICRHERLRNRLSRMGSNRVRSLFTWTGIAQQIIEIVENPAKESTVSFPDDQWDDPWIDGE